MSRSRAYAQKTPDSLLTALKSQNDSEAKAETLIELSEFYYHRDPNIGIDYSNKAMALSKKLGYQTGIAKSWMGLGKHRMVLGDNDKAKIALDNSIALFKKQGDNCNIGVAYMHRGSLLGNLSKFPDALDALFEALRHLERCDDRQKRKIYSANSYQNTANIYNATENFDKALINYDKAIAMWNALPHEEISASMNLASKGIVYEKQKKYDEAVAVYTDAKNQLKALLPNAEVPMAFVDSWLSKAYFDKEMFDESLASSNKALVVIQKIGDQDLLASTMQNIAGAMLYKGIKTNNPGLAKQGYEKLQEAIGIHKQIGNHEGLIADYKFMTDYFKFDKKFDKVLEANQLSNTYEDSVFNFKNKQSLQNLEDERTIELRNKELEISKLAIDNKEKQKWYLIAAISLLAIIGLLLYNQSRNRRRTNQKLLTLNVELQEADRVKTRFFSILNHDLRAPVARLISFLRLQKESPELLDAHSRERIENQTMTSAENLLESMEDMLLWTKGQMENFSPKPRLIKVSDVFHDIKQHFDGANATFNFSDNGLSLETDPNYLKTIMRNLTANSLKAMESAQNGIISWTAFEQGSKTCLSITDNGPGAAQEKFRALYDEKEVVGIKTGLGLHLIRDLAKAIGCKLSVVSETEKGTTFTLNFE